MDSVYVLQIMDSVHVLQIRDWLSPCFTKPGLSPCFRVQSMFFESSQVHVLQHAIQMYCMKYCELKLHLYKRNTYITPIRQDVPLVPIKVYSQCNMLWCYVPVLR